MKIPFIRRRVTAAAEPVKQAQKALGASGTINYHGFIQSEEYNSDLRGLKGLTTLDKMIRSDGSTQEALEHIYAPIKNATITVDAPENPVTDELVATALVEAAFFKLLNMPFLEYLDQVVDYLAFGHQVFETPMQVVDHELSYVVPGEFDVDKDGARIPRTVIVPSQQWIVWDRFEQRLQRTLWKWIAPTGKLESIVQQTWNVDRYTTIEIPASDLIVLTNKKRGDDFTGRSILRAAYKSWYMKELIERIEAVALERWGVGIIVAYPPLSKADDSAYLARLEDICASLRAGESTYIVATGPKQTSGPNGGEGVLFEIIGPTGTPPDFKSPKEYHRAEIKAAVLARFAELGHAQTGARSTGDTQAVVWFAALHAVARYIADVHQPAIKRLVDLNLPGITRYPTLQFSGIEEKDLAQFADSISKLVAAQAIKADRSFRGFVRDTVDAPPEDEIDDTEPAQDPGLNPDDPESASASDPAEVARREAAKEKAAAQASIRDLGKRVDALTSELASANTEEREQFTVRAAELQAELRSREETLRRYAAEEAHAYRKTLEALSQQTAEALRVFASRQPEPPREPQQLALDVHIHQDGEVKAMRRVIDYDNDGRIVGAHDEEV